MLGMRPIPQSAGESPLREFNPCHDPASGKFCSTGTAGMSAEFIARNDARAADIYRNAAVAAALRTEAAVRAGVVTPVVDASAQQPQVSGASVDTLLTWWTEGTGRYDWSDMQHAAWAVINGMDPQNYVCYDCRGDDQNRYSDVKLLLGAIERAPVLSKPLFRGVMANPSNFQIGTEFSESLSSWTGNRKLAEDFARGVYARLSGGGQVVMVVESHKARGLRAPSTVPLADEYVSSGAYRVVARAVKNGITYVKVRRVGSAKGSVGGGAVRLG